MAGHALDRVDDLIVRDLGDGAGQRRVIQAAEAGVPRVQQDRIAALAVGVEGVEQPVTLLVSGMNSMALLSIVLSFLR